MTLVPVIDLGDADTPRRIDAACRDTGFFCVTGHGVDAALAERLDDVARDFFARSDEEKAAISMAHGGLAWRGWFPVGGELTSGVPDLKEGLYLGAELSPDDPRVRTGVPLHGPNQFPSDPAALRDIVLAWLDTMTALGHTIMAKIALGLGLPPDWFARHLTADPTVLLRIFHYPPGDDRGWGVAEHTDYGLLTILLQDDCGGLQVKSRDGWIGVEPQPGLLVCNIGDMLDRMTSGRYRSTPHRVRNVSGRDRISVPFFFDPSWDARVTTLPLDGAAPPDDKDSRWDRLSVHAWDGTYGEYLTRKVSKVFPELRDAVLPD
jgi:isopenicillin N synthase-like dioxygenase